MKKYLLGIENVIWDWNGTLLNDALLNRNVLNEMMVKRGISPIDLDQYRNLFCFPISKLYQRLGFDLLKEDFESLSNEYHITYTKRLHELVLNEGALDLLELFSQKGLNQYVLSACEQNALRDAMRQFDIATFFTTVYGIDNIHATGKIELGERLVRETGINPERTLMIGDTIHDAEVAETLGFNCLLFAGGHNSTEMLSAKGEVLTDLREVCGEMKMRV